MTTDERVDALFLEHFGVKGMHWGVRKQRAVSTQERKDTGVLRRQTKVKTKGGESHPATDDAVTAAIQRAKLKKSGPAALTTPELAQLNRRLQLEAQAEFLASSKGKRFVSKQLDLEAEAQIRESIRSGTGVAAKKVAKRGAKAGAVAAVL